MGGAPAAERAEGLDVVKGDRGLRDNLVGRVYRLHACEMKDRTEKHRGMAGGKNEPVAIRPHGIFRIKTEKALP